MSSAHLKTTGLRENQDDGAITVSSPQPLEERVAVFGAVLYAIAIVVEAVRSRAWVAAGLFVIVAAAALWVAGARVRYRLERRLLIVSWHFPGRGRSLRFLTSDLVDFIASDGSISAITRSGGEIILPRGTIRTQEEARMLADLLRTSLGHLREREASYRAF